MRTRSHFDNRRTIVGANGSGGGKAIAKRGMRARFFWRKRQGMPAQRRKCLKRDESGQLYRNSNGPWKLESMARDQGQGVSQARNSAAVGASSGQV